MFILAKTSIMKKTTFLFASLILLTGLVACTSEPEATEGQEGTEESCTYSYNEGTTTLDWTAFKTTSKVPVEGSFNEFEVTAESGADPKKVAESMSFTIKTASVETNNPDRNTKIYEHFFQVINTPEIKGSVKSLGEDGKAVVAITMNNITFDVEGTYLIDDVNFDFKATIDVAAWNGMPGIEALNGVCKDLHAGEDKVSKLWSEVEISFFTKLKSDCK